jgi:K+-transporting ATPase c subunit
MKSEKNTGLTVVTQHENEVPGGNLLAHIWSAIGVTLVLGVVCCGIYPLVVWGIGHLFFPVQAYGSLVQKDGTYTTDDSKAVGSALIGQNFTAPQYFWPRPSAAGAGYDATDSGATNLGPLSDKLINGLTTPATTQPTTQPESVSFMGVRLQTIHYAVANKIPFKFCQVTYDSNGVETGRTEVPTSKYIDNQGNINDTALIDAFPHPPQSGAQITGGLIAADFGTLIPGDAVTCSGSGLDPHISPNNAKIQAGRVAAARGIAIDKFRR